MDQVPKAGALTAEPSPGTREIARVVTAARRRRNSEHRPAGRLRAYIGAGTRY